MHNIKLDKGNEGKNGHGLAVLVAPSCSDYVRVLKTSENVQCICLQCDRKMFGLEEDVIVGATYINPQSRDFPVRAIQINFTDLFEDTLGAFQVSPNVVLCGDFNAHVGELSDAHTGFVLDCPEVLETRRYVCNSVNKAGQLLVYLAAAMSMAIATGRVVGDDGQPSLTGNYGDKKS